jgi:hypothetical protein
MTKPRGRPKRTRLEPSDYHNSDDLARTLLEAGGPESDALDEARGQTGFHGELLRAIYGANDSQFIQGIEGELQIERSHVFVRKARDRKGAQIPRPHDFFEKLPAKSLLSLADFCSVTKAAEFAGRFEFYFECHVTLSWQAMDVAAGEIPAALETFRKSLQDRCREMDESIAYIYAHENGPKKGLHTHFLCTMPGQLQKREELRQWIRDWPARFIGQRPGNAIRLTGPRVWKAEPSRSQEQIHWELVHYVLKGIDPRIIVQDAQYSPDGRPVRLGDLVARSFRDPGVVPFRKRVGISQNIGSSRQAIGCPSGLGVDARQKRPDVVHLDDRPTILPDHLPILSSWDSGARDIWGLTPPVFASWSRGSRLSQNRLSKSNQNLTTTPLT